jgi:hypothetical protein
MKILKKINLFLFFIFVIGNFALGNDAEHAVNLEPTAEPLYVSLGSICAPASMLREAGVRRAAFPFDWMISVDGEKLIELLENNFLNFLDQKYLKPFMNNGILLQNYYHMEFSHEGDWHNYNRVQKIEKLQNLTDKFQRRITRFRNLNNYSGKVVFIRVAWPLSVHPNYAFADKGNLEISKEYALRLRNALKKLLPNLNFHLVIMNTSDASEIGIIKAADNVHIISKSIHVKQLDELIGLTD